jgi:hypothetical protein
MMVSVVGLCTSGTPPNDMPLPPYVMTAAPLTSATSQMRPWVAQVPDCSRLRILLALTELDRGVVTVRAAKRQYMVVFLDMSTMVPPGWMGVASVMSLGR